MKRFIGLALAGVALSGCSDRVTMPTSSLKPAGAAYDEFGDPPPPPIGSSDGFADFSTRSEFAGTTGQAAPKGGSNLDSPICSAFTTFTFKYKYLANTQNNNQWLHINPDDPSKQIEIHWTDKSHVDAHGVIVGPDNSFTFTIKNALAAEIFKGDGRLPYGVHLTVTGLLKTGGTSCSTTADFTAYLQGGPQFF